MSDGERKATYEDLMELPEDVKAEVIDGVVRVQPAASNRHGFGVGELFFHLRSAGFGGRGKAGWWLIADVDVRLSKHRIVRPDLVGWRQERMPYLPDGRPVDLRPDWVCEVLAPSNERHDRKTKARLYAEAGLPNLWLLDPAAHTLEAFVLGADGRWIVDGVSGEGDVANVAPFETVALDVGELFAPEPPEP